MAKADIRVLLDVFTFCVPQEQDVLEGYFVRTHMVIECQAIRLTCERATKPKWSGSDSGWAR